MEENMQAVGGILGNLKSMATDMGAEIEKQNSQLDRINDKVHVLLFYFETMLTVSRKGFFYYQATIPTPETIIQANHIRFNDVKAQFGAGHLICFSFGLWFLFI